MFTFNYIAIGVGLMFGPLLLVNFLHTRGLMFILKLNGLVVIIASAYCFAAGLWMVTGWSDPILGTIVSSGSDIEVGVRRRGGIIKLAIQYWPYILMGIGGFLTLVGFGSFAMKKEIAE